MYSRLGAFRDSRPATRACLIGMVALLVTIAGNAADAAVAMDDGAVIRPYLTANGLLNRGMYDLAIPEYERFLDAHAEHEKANHARYGLAVCYFQLNRRSDAAPILADLAEESDFEFAGEVDLLNGHCLFDAREYAAAAKAFGEVVAREPEHASASDAAAMVVESSYRAGDFAGAASAGAEAAGRWPDSPQRDRVELFRAYAEAALGNHEAVVARATELLRVAPNSPLAPHAELAMAQSLARLNRSENAAERFRSALRSGHEAIEPEALYGLATIEARAGDTRSADRRFDELLRKHPDHQVTPHARFERARMWLAAGNPRQARRHLDDLIKAGAGELADDASYTVGRCLLAENEPDAAAEVFSSAIERFPKSDLLDVMMYDRAVALIRDESFDEARSALQEFRATFAEHRLVPDALHAEIQIVQRSNDHESTLDLSRRFLSVAPDHLAAESIRLAAAESLYQMERYDEAKSELERLGSVAPDSAIAVSSQYRLGMTLYRLGQFDESYQRLEPVATSDEAAAQYPMAAFCLGDIEFSRARWAEAERWLRQYLNSGASSAADDAWLKLGLALARQDRHDDALAAYQEVLRNHQSSPHVEQALFELGQSQLALDRASDAAESFDRLLRDFEDSRFAPHALRHRAAIEHDRGNHEAAADWLTRAAEQGDESFAAQSQYDAGLSLLAAGDYEDAAERFRRVIKDTDQRDPLQHQATAQLFIAASRAGDQEEALKAAESLEYGRLDPALANSTRYEHAWLTNEAGRSEEAATLYESLLANEPKPSIKAHALLDLASMAMSEDDFSSAEQRLIELRAVLDQKDWNAPDELHAQAQYRLATCALKRGDHETVAELLATFATDRPAHSLAASADLMAGEANLKLGRHERAASHLERAVESSNDDIIRPALLRLGEAQATLHRWARSEETFERFLDTYADDDQWFQAEFGRAWAHENQGRYGDAIDGYQRLVDRHEGPTTARAQFQIGQCYFAQKQHEEALRELMKVDILYAYPEWSAAALFEAGRVLLALNRPSEAQAQFEQVIERFPESNWSTLAAEKADEAKAAMRLPGR